MVSFGEKAKIKRREIWIKVVVMFLQLYCLQSSEKVGVRFMLYGSSDCEELNNLNLWVVYRMT